MPVSSKHQQYVSWESRWKTIRDCDEGEEAVKNAGTRYLPKPSGHKNNQDAYEAYIARAVYTDVLRKTISSSVGIVMRKDTLFDLPKELEYLKNSATPSGETLSLLIKQTIKNQVKLSRFGVLVDKPISDGLTKMIGYEAEQIINWREVIKDGKKSLSLVVLEETENISTDPFKEEMEIIYLVLKLDVNGFYTVSKWRKSKNSNSFEQKFVEEILPKPTKSGELLPYIPFVFFGASGLRPSIEKPHLLGMANMTIALYRNSADREQALFLVGQPTPVVTGLTEQQDLLIGSSTAWILPHEATAMMLEISGAGIGAQRDAMTDKTVAISAMGARFLEGRQRSNISEETERLQQNSELSVLMDIVDTATLGFEKALQWVADWEDADKSKIKVHLNKDFSPEIMEPQMLNALGKARQSGDISKQTYHYNLTKGEIIMSGKSFEDEQSDILEQTPTFTPTDA